MRIIERWTYNLMMSCWSNLRSNEKKNHIIAKLPILTWLFLHLKYSSISSAESSSVTSPSSKSSSNVAGNFLALKWH